MRVTIQVKKKNREGMVGKLLPTNLSVINLKKFRRMEALLSRRINGMGASIGLCLPPVFGIGGSALKMFNASLSSSILKLSLIHI